MGWICSLWCIISEIWDFLYLTLVVKNCLSLRFLIGGAVAGFWTYDLFLCVLVHEIDYICIFFGSRSYQKTKMKYRPSVTHPNCERCCLPCILLQPIQRIGQHILENCDPLYRRSLRRPAEMDIQVVVWWPMVLLAVRERIHCTVDTEGVIDGSQHLGLAKRINPLHLLTFL